MLIDYNYKKGLNIMFNPFSMKCFPPFHCLVRFLFYYIKIKRDFKERRGKYINQATVYLLLNAIVRI